MRSAWKILVPLVPVLLLGCLRREPPPVLILSRPDPGDHWHNLMGRHEIESLTAPRGQIVFLGDSMITNFPLQEAFPDVTILNRGIDGERIDELPLRSYSAVTALHPSRIFLMVGINDIIAPLIPEERRADNYDLLLTELRMAAPQAEINVMTLLPLGGRYIELNRDVRRFNRVIRRTARHHDVRVIDVWPALADENGQLDADDTVEGLHLNPRGYAKWAEALRPYL